MKQLRQTYQEADPIEDTGSAYEESYSNTIRRGLLWSIGIGCCIAIGLVTAAFYVFG